MLTLIVVVNYILVERTTPIWQKEVSEIAEHFAEGMLEAEGFSLIRYNTLLNKYIFSIFHNYSTRNPTKSLADKGKLYRERGN